MVFVKRRTFRAKAWYKIKTTLNRIVLNPQHFMLGFGIVLLQISLTKHEDLLFLFGYGLFLLSCIKIVD